MKKILYSLTILSALSTASVQAYSSNYTITAITPPSGNSSVGYGISSNGLVTGLYQDGAHYGAFIYDGATARSLSTNSFSTFRGYGINAQSEVVGSTNTLNYFHHDGTTSSLIGTLGGRSSYGQNAAINDAGQYTGESLLANGATRAFISTAGAMVPIDTLGGQSAAGFGISQSGNVTGYSVTANHEQHAFLYDGSTVSDLGTLGGRNSFGYDVNDYGFVVGEADTAQFGRHAFLHDGTTMQDLGTLGTSLFSSAYGINNSGQIVGDSGFGKAFLYENNTMLNLCDVVNCTDSGWLFLSTAQGINDNGDIVGTGNYQGTERAFLISSAASVPEPTTILMALTGLIGSLGFSRRRKNLISNS